MDDTGVDIGFEKMLLKSEKLSHEGKTLCFAVDNQIAGIIAVADVVKKSSKMAIEELHKMGIEVVMITGIMPGLQSHRKTSRHR